MSNQEKDFYADLFKEYSKENKHKSITSNTKDNLQETQEITPKKDPPKKNIQIKKKKTNKPLVVVLLLVISISIVAAAILITLKQTLNETIQIHLRDIQEKQELKVKPEQKIKFIASDNSASILKIDSIKNGALFFGVGSQNGEETIIEVNIGEEKTFKFADGDHKVKIEIISVGETSATISLQKSNEE